MPEEHRVSVRFGEGPLIKKQTIMELKNIIKGTADIASVMSGGIVEYKLTDVNGHTYQLAIDLSDKHDVGETATFMAHYDKSITLMRWIRRAIDNETLIQLS